MNISERKNNIQYLNNFFDKIYVVTISRACKRHKFIEEKLAGLDFEFVYGQDKNDLDESKVHSIYDDKSATSKRYRGSSLRLSVIAIAISHRMVYEKMIQDNVEKALIFEDDAFFIENNLSFIPNILNELPDNWELLYLGYNDDKKAKILDKINIPIYLIMRFFGKYHKTQKQILNRFSKGFSKHLRIAGDHNSAHSYGITKNAAKKLVKHQTPVQYAADNLLTALSTDKLLNSFISKPPIFTQIGLQKIHKIKSMNV